MVDPLLLERILADNGIGQHGIDRFYSLSHALPQIARFLISFFQCLKFSCRCPGRHLGTPHMAFQSENPSPTATSTSTVGFPRESRISLPVTLRIGKYRNIVFPPVLLQSEQ